MPCSLCSLVSIKAGSMVFLVVAGIVVLTLSISSYDGRLSAVTAAGNGDIPLSTERTKDLGIGASSRPEREAILAETVYRIQFPPLPQGKWQVELMADGWEINRILHW